MTGWGVLGFFPKQLKSISRSQGRVPPLEQCIRALEAGTLSPTDLVELCLEVIGKREGQVQAWAHLATDAARAEARERTAELARGARRSLLHGIPFGAKDIYDTAGMPTGYGSPLYAGRIPAADSDLIIQLREAGAILLGKTRTTAFAYFDPGPTTNPWNPAFTPGGSSSGSAAAVAAGMVPFALGSQTFGSVLRPASFCGIVGLKPTYGQLSTRGMLPLAPSLDHAGLFTATVAGMFMLWRALRKNVPARPAPKRLTIPDPFVAMCADKEMEEAFQRCADRLSAKGFRVATAPVPQSFVRLLDDLQVVLKFEGAETHRERWEKHGEAMGAKLAELVKEGLALPDRVYESALERIQQARRDFSGLLATHPVFLTPAAPGQAPRGLARTGDPRCNGPWTALGLPAVAIPMALSQEGLPLGLQLAAASGEESSLLTTAEDCAAALGFSAQAP